MPRSLWCLFVLQLDRTQLKTDQVHAEGLNQRMQAIPNRPQKQTIDPAPSNIDTLVNQV